MQTAVNNQADVDLFSSLQTDDNIQSIASTAMKPSDALVRKLLHPPSSVPEYCGLPTNDSRSQVCIEWRNMEVMSAPRVLHVINELPAVVELQPNDLSQFDVAYLCPTGARINSIAFVYDKQSGSMVQDLANCSTQQLYDFKQWRYDANVYRPTYKSTTFYPNMTAFNDTGMVAGNQFNPSILFAGTLLDLSFNSPGLFYSMVCSMYHSGQVTASARFPRNLVEDWEKFPHYHRVEILKKLNLSPGDSINLDPNTTHQVINFNTVFPTASSNYIGPRPVPTTAQILGNSMRSLGCKAKEGMFSVQRLNTIAPKWMAASTVATSSTAELQGLPGLYQCWVAGIDPSTSQPIAVALLDNMDLGSFINPRFLYDTQWSADMTWSWIRFSGLSMNPNSNQTTNLLIRKTYVGLEVQPSPTSAWAGMIKLGPKPDLMAMQAVMDGFYELKDVMPARYNFWGTIASIASSGLKTFGTSLLSSLASKYLPKLATGLLSSTGSKTRSNNNQNKKPKPRSNGQSAPIVKDIDKQVQALSRKIDGLVVNRPTVVRNIRRGTRSYSDKSRTNRKSKVVVVKK